MAADMDPIRFKADISRVATSPDGGAKLTLNIPETEIVAAAKLLAMMKMVVEVEIKVEE